MGKNTEQFFFLCYVRLVTPRAVGPVGAFSVPLVEILFRRNNVDGSL